MAALAALIFIGKLVVGAWVEPLGHDIPRPEETRLAHGLVVVAIPHLSDHADLAVEIAERGRVLFDGGPEDRHPGLTAGHNRLEVGRRVVNSLVAATVDPGERSGIADHDLGGRHLDSRIRFAGIHDHNLDVPTIARLHVEDVSYLDPGAMAGDKLPCGQGQGISSHARLAPRHEDKSQGEDCYGGGRQGGDGAVVGVQKGHCGAQPVHHLSLAEWVLAWLVVLSPFIAAAISWLAIRDVWAPSPLRAAARYARPAPSSRRKRTMLETP